MRSTPRRYRERGVGDHPFGPDNGSVGEPDPVSFPAVDEDFPDQLAAEDLAPVLLDGLFQLVRQHLGSAGRVRRAPHVGVDEHRGTENHRQLADVTTAEGSAQGVEKAGQIRIGNNLVEEVFSIFVEEVTEPERADRIPEEHLDILLSA